jgi:hypothetical protein
MRSMQIHSSALVWLLMLLIAGCSANSGPPVTVADPAAASPVAPDVQLSFSPQTLSAGDSATLTWSSMNATACWSSGMWSGSEPLSSQSGFNTGALTDGTYSYGLTRWERKQGRHDGRGSSGGPGCTTAGPTARNPPRRQRQPHLVCIECSILQRGWWYGNRRMGDHTGSIQYTRPFVRPLHLRG